jgi:outer membrane immunogenic protein
MLRIATLNRLLSTTALIALPFSAYAADMAVKAPVYRADAGYNWTGFYAGGNAGYSFGRSSVASSETSNLAVATGGITVNLGPFLPANTAANANLNGAIGGLQAGYNWQLSRNWVTGLEADFQGSGEKSTSTVSQAVAGLTTATTFTSKLEWFGTLRGRLGFVPDTLPKTLFYGTGGLAYGSINTSQAVSVGPTTPILGFAGTLIAANGADTQTKVGWTLGAGVESAFLEKWTWKLEYLHVDLGTASRSGPLSCSAPGFNTLFPIPGGGYSCQANATRSNRITDEIVRVGVNYRF